MILIEIVGRQEFAINRLLAALNEAADSFKNVGLSVDAEDCERVIEESLSGGNPGEPKACTGAEERGISGATGAGQHPDGNPESTGDSADRRSPDGTARTPSPDESHRHPHEPKPSEANGIKPVAIVVEQLDDNEARVRWIFNPVPEGQELQWDHGPPHEPLAGWQPIDSAPPTRDKP